MYLERKHSYLLKWTFSFREANNFVLVRKMILHLRLKIIKFVLKINNKKYLMRNTGHGAFSLGIILITF